MLLVWYAMDYGVQFVRELFVFGSKGNEERLTGPTDAFSRSFGICSDPSDGGMMQPLMVKGTRAESLIT